MHSKIFFLGIFLDEFTIIMNLKIYLENSQACLFVQFFLPVSSYFAFFKIYIPYDDEISKIIHLKSDQYCGFLLF